MNKYIRKFIVLLVLVCLFMNSIPIMASEEQFSEDQNSYGNEEAAEIPGFIEPDTTEQDISDQQVAVPEPDINEEDISDPQTTVSESDTGSGTDVPSDDNAGTEDTAFTDTSSDDGSDENAGLNNTEDPGLVDESNEQNTFSDDGIVHENEPSEDTLEYDIEDPSENHDPENVENNLAEQDSQGTEDPAADVEDSTYWNNMFSGIALSGIWREDLVTIAKTQIGYTESTENYIVDENNVQKGYSRYGAWFGYPYADWSGLFIAFCMYYAGIPDNAVPFEMNCAAWKDLLAQWQMYKPAGTYDPVSGDIVFLSDDSVQGCTAGIVSEVIDGADYFSYITGDFNDAVCVGTMDSHDPCILGFGVLSDNTEMPEEEHNETVKDSEDNPDVISGSVGLMNAKEEPVSRVVILTQEESQTQTTMTPGILTSLYSAQIAISEQTYSGKALKPAPFVFIGNKRLIQGVDYTVTYRNNINAGTAIATITGIGFYRGIRTVTFRIRPKPVIPNVTLLLSSLTYNGLAKRPGVIVKCGNMVLSPAYYSVNYTNNINAGTASVIVTLKGNYTGRRNLSFRINPKTIIPDVTLSPSSFTYNGLAKQPAVTVRDRNTALSCAYYDVTCINNVNAGTAIVWVRLKGNYSGSRVATFRINPKNCIPAVTLSSTEYTFDGSEKRPGITVKVGDTTLSSSDYTVAYRNNTNVGTAAVQVTLKGNYKGSVSVPFRIKAKVPTADTLTMTLSGSSYVYDGTEKKPDVTVNVGDTVLSSSEYTVSYKNNINVGTATVSVILQGNYSGRFSATFRINAKEITPTLSLSETSFNYDGTAKEPAVTVRDGSNIFSASDYTVTYSNNINAGTATVTVTMKGNYTGTASATFEIIEINSITIDGVTYEKITDTTCRVVSYDGEAVSFSIPDTVLSWTVTEIGPEAFMGNTMIGSIDLPNSITVIGARAFKDCINLNSMTKH